MLTSSQTLLGVSRGGFACLQICMIDTSTFAAANAEGYRKMRVVSKRLASTIALSVGLRIWAGKMYRESLMSHWWLLSA
jgi:hypothetical protein